MIYKCGGTKEMFCTFNYFKTNLLDKHDQGKQFLINKNFRTLEQLQRKVAQVTTSS